MPPAHPYTSGNSEGLSLCRSNKQRHSPNCDSVSPNPAQRTENSIQKYKELHMSVLLQEEKQAVVIVTDQKRKLHDQEFPCQVRFIKVEVYLNLLRGCEDNE